MNELMENNEEISKELIKEKRNYSFSPSKVYFYFRTNFQGMGSTMLVDT